MILGSVRRAAIACLMVLIPLAAPGYSQETTGMILGTLIDQTGAVLPGVKVGIVSLETGQKHESTTNNLGQYSISLPIGNYEISFTLPNFRPFTTRVISVHVNDRYQVNGTLKAGAVEALTVTAERLVQRTSAVQSLISPTAVRELPLRTRSFVQLVTLVPGVSSDLREEACFCDQGNLNISINGARRSAVNWLLDGVSNVNGWNNYTLVTTPSLEAIKEINVITSSYSAEWARNGGGIVNAVTKSGSNRFSGSAYQFLRHDALSAIPFLRTGETSASVNTTPARLRYNNFGYTVGGPVPPTREKLFFFFSQEWRRSTGEQHTYTGSSPNPSWLSDPANRNYVPPEARDPNAVKLLTLWPASNVPGTTLYRTTFPNQLDTHQEFVRADYNATANWALTGRYLHDRVDSIGEYSTTTERVAGHRALVGDLMAVVARRAGRSVLHELSYQLSSNEQSPKDRMHTRPELGIVIPEYFLENASNLIPIINVGGLYPIWGEQPRPREYRNHTFSGVVTVQRSAHTLKAGALAAFEHLNSNLSPKSTQGEFTFQAGGGFTAFQNFLRGNSDGACGEACSYSETDTDVLNRFRTDRYEVFVQDTWRIHSKITFDAGVRYGYYPPLTDDNNMLFTFSPDAYDRTQAPSFADVDGFLVVPGTGNLFNGIHVAGKDSPYGRGIYASDRNNLQPRVGVAWDPTAASRLVVRAGYGVYFDEIPVGIFAENVQTSAYDPFRTDLFASNASLSNPLAGTVTNSLLYTPWTFATSEQLVAPRWQHWNFGVQRRVYSHGVIDAGYVGSRGDHLLRFVDINQPQPEDVVPLHGTLANPVRPFVGYDFIRMRETTAKSRNHGLLATFRHESGQLLAVVNYTFSRTMADATYDSSIIDDPQNPLDANAEFAPAITDRRHIFNAWYVYELPSTGQTDGWKKALLADWQVAGMTMIESGPAGRIQVTNCNYGSPGWCFPGDLRPNQAGDPEAGDQTGLLWFNPAAFVPSPAGEYGTAPVAPFRLPGRHQWDFSVSKRLSLIGTTRLQLRADVINAFNQLQYLDVNTTCAGTTQCNNFSPGFGKVKNARPPRQFQLGARVDW